MKHEIINQIIRQNRYTRYLEIGLGAGINFKKIEAAYKVGVDPELPFHFPRWYEMTSDKFFDVNKDEFDVVFIDGLHHADQVRRDINNASACLSKKGCIILHDTIPPNEKAQRVPREQMQWTGDVWRAVVGLIHQGVQVTTFKADYGLTVIYPKGEVFNGEYEDSMMKYEYFDENKEEFLNIE